jgi:hypothetical protein
MMTRELAMPRLPHLVVLALLSYMAVMIVVVVPPNVDEAIQYHPIACSAYANARYHEFWNACDGSTDLTFASIHIPKAYDYIGLLSSILYWPFFRLYPRIVTQRLIGIGFLLAMVALASRLERRDRLSILVLFGLSFPLQYQLIADTGPVRYGLWVLLLTPSVVAAISRVDSARLRLVFNVVLGTLVFLAVEDKPFFVYLLPSVCALTLAYNSRGRLLDDIRDVLRRVWVSVALCSILIALYLFGTHTSTGATYFTTLAESVRPATITTVAADIVSYMTNFEKFSNMVYETRRFRVLNVSMSLLVWLWGCVFVVRAFRVDPLLRRRLSLTIAAFILGVIAILVTRNAWSGHHFIYCFVLALLLVCQAVVHVETNRRMFLAAYAVVAVTLATELPYLEPGKVWSWERYKVFDYLRRNDIAGNYIITHASLGTYYLASLYGHQDQLSVQVRALDDTTARRILDLSARVQRKVLCVCRGEGCDAESLSARFFGEVVFTQAPLANENWKVFREATRMPTQAGSIAAAGSHR